MPVELPIFHLGTYRDSSGVPVTFTPALLHQLAKNTKLAIKHNFQPPIGYDHPAARDNGAHGRISDVRVEQDKWLIATLDTTSEQLKDDAKNFRRLTYSPEFNNFEFVHEGETVKLGPTVIGLSMLGAQRGAIKNTDMVPLSKVNFGEGVDSADAFIMRSELRSLGYLGEYDVDGKFFAEVENDERRFSAHEENTMTDAEIKQLIADGIKAGVDASVGAAVTAAVKPLQDQIKSFSETSKRQSEVRAFCESVRTEKKSLNKLSLDRAEVILLHEDMTPALDKEFRAFVEGLSAVILPGGVAGKKTDGADGDEGGDEIDEPKTLASVRPKHFSDLSKNDAMLSQATDELQKIKPKLFSEAKATTSVQRLAVLKQHIIEREAEAN